MVKIITVKMKKYFEVNKNLWDSRTQSHLNSEFYNMEGFRRGETSLNPIELALLGDIQGKKILHLQCHFGQDSLSLSRMGAKVTGVDLSETGIEAARNLAQELGIDATFIQANVYETLNHIQDKYDIVFLSYGAICWLPDLDLWANITAQSLKQGGQLIMAEFHPVLYMYNWENHQIEYGYFNTGKPYLEQVSGTYATDEQSESLEEYFWIHAISEVIQALLNNGMEIKHMSEYDYSPYNCFENMKERARGQYVYNITDLQFPHVFALIAQKK